ncbi:RAD51-associated protein 1 isoform X2 [Mastomys coucha]|uniref:RAD51-associated protein 1 isoform X2 n=1 Tax=Mastomys coucha TaxID=35658 RepID=UPI001262A697|nr:RAD51-associated protein 1 isoform X2 [Mastomys coucha]
MACPGKGVCARSGILSSARRRRLRQASGDWRAGAPGAWRLTSRFWAGIETAATAALQLWSTATLETAPWCALPGVCVYVGICINKKPVNYSQFEDSGSDSDDDFISVSVNKSKTVPKVLKQEKPKPNLKNLQKEEVLPTEPPKKRVALDDKVFQRGLEVALALSVKNLPTLTNQVKESEEKSSDKQGKRKTEKTDKPPHFSNCSVASDDVDLNKITEEGDAEGVEGERKAASEGEALPRRVLSEDSGASSANDTEPEGAAGEDSESDPDFDENEESDEDFGVRRSKETKKKTVQKKPAGEKREKKSKPKCEASVTSVDPAPAAIKSGSPSLPQAIGLPSEATRKPAIMCSPSAESKRPKWVPPAASGSRNSSSSPLAGIPAKSPSQSLRLGLSRLAPVKRLHPSATSSQVR